MHPRQVAGTARPAVEHFPVDTAAAEIENPHLAPLCMNGIDQAFQPV
jgi:hypothetical protein